MRATKNKTILVIDNDKSSLYILEIILKKTNKYNLLFASNKDEVYKHCKSNVEFDLVLIEPLLPCKKGYALIKLIKRAKKNTPVIALTVCALDFEKDKCFEYGCDTFISKPFIRTNLLNIIEQYLKTS